MIPNTLVEFKTNTLCRQIFHGSTNKHSSDNLRRIIIMRKIDTKIKHKMMELKKRRIKKIEKRYGKFSNNKYYKLKRKFIKESGVSWSNF